MAKEQVYEVLSYDKMQNEIITELFPEIEELDEDMIEIISSEVISQLENIKEYINENIGTETFYLIGGSAGVWTGNHEYEVQEAGNWERLVSEVSNGKDDVEFKVYKQNDGYFIEAWGWHHDGTNYYEFSTLEALTENQLRELFNDEIGFEKTDDRYDIIEKIENYYYYN